MLNPLQYAIDPLAREAVSSMLRCRCTGVPDHVFALAFSIYYIIMGGEEQARVFYLRRPSSGTELFTLSGLSLHQWTTTPASLPLPLLHGPVTPQMIAIIFTHLMQTTPSVTFSLNYSTRTIAMRHPADLTIHPATSFIMIQSWWINTNFQSHLCPPPFPHPWLIQQGRHSTYFHLWIKPPRPIHLRQLKEILLTPHLRSEMRND